MTSELQGTAIRETAAGQATWWQQQMEHHLCKGAEERILSLIIARHHPYHVENVEARYGKAQVRSTVRKGQ